MTPFEGLLYGFQVAATPVNLLAALVGAMLGTAVGVLPGFGPTAGCAVILPLTYSLGPVTGLIAMAGMYYGAMYGGSTTSILVNIPGEVASIVTCIDGHQMTKKGRAGAALAIVALGSFVAGTIGLIGVQFFAPPLASFALNFGAAEYFALTSVALLALAGIASRSFPRALFVTAIGLVSATVGVEAVTGVSRFNFNYLPLARGIDVVAVAVGLYGVSEILFVVESLAGSARAQSVRLRELFPNREELLRAFAPWVRGGLIGFFLGLLPGPATALSTFTAYRVEKSLSKRKEEFGQGAVEGLAGPEAANNAASEAVFVPLLALGIPFTPIMALMVAAMMVHGIQPGPLLMIKNPEIFWGVIASMYLGNVMCLVLNLPLVGLWVSLLRIPAPILSSGIVFFAVIGSYSMNNSLFDLWVLLAFGVIGYMLRKMDFDLAGLILGVVLGPLIERYFRQGMFTARGDLFYFVSSPIAVALWVAGLLVVAGPPLLKMIRRGRASAGEREEAATM